MKQRREVEAHAFGRGLHPLEELVGDFLKLGGIALGHQQPGGVAVRHWLADPAEPLHEKLAVLVEQPAGDRLAVPVAFRPGGEEGPGGVGIEQGPLGENGHAGVPAMLGQVLVDPRKGRRRIEFGEAGADQSELAGLLAGEGRFLERQKPP